MAIVATVNAAGFIARLVLGSVVLLMMLDNLSVDVTELAARLSFGGIAVAVATESTHGDLFASLSIVRDMPFMIGNFLIFERLEQEGIRLAYPTPTLFLAQSPDK